MYRAKYHQQRYVTEQVGGKTADKGAVIVIVFIFVAVFLLVRSCFFIQVGGKTADKGAVFTVSNGQLPGERGSDR